MLIQIDRARNARASAQLTAAGLGVHTAGCRKRMRPQQAATVMPCVTSQPAASAGSPTPLNTSATSTAVPVPHATS
jgi:hypothetical protein